MLIGLTEYTTPAHIARATLEATAFQTYAILECMQSDAGADLKQLKVDGGMTNGDVAMQILADLGGIHGGAPGDAGVSLCISIDVFDESLSLFLEDRPRWDPRCWPAQRLDYLVGMSINQRP
jgi:hypothetical protein